MFRQSRIGAIPGKRFAMKPGIARLPSTPHTKKANMPRTGPGFAFKAKACHLSSHAPDRYMESTIPPRFVIFYACTSPVSIQVLHGRQMELLRASRWMTLQRELL